MNNEYTHISTLNNLMHDLEKQMREKHTLMQKIRNEFMVLKRQHHDLAGILKKLEDDPNNTK